MPWGKRALVVLLIGVLGCCLGVYLTQQQRSTAGSESVKLPTLPAFPRPTSTPTPTALPPTPTPPPTVEPALVLHGDRSLPYVALTFDACQTAELPAGYDQKIIEILTETNTPATLFLGGLWMQTHREQTRELAANPLFELGNHSWSHPDFAGIGAEEMDDEIALTQDLMYRLTGKRATLFRFPSGSYTDEALEVAGRHGLRAILWDVVSGDADRRVSAKAMIGAVTGQARNGSIVVMHMNGRGWHTAEALPVMIERLHAKGYRLVTVSQLLEMAPPLTPDAPPDFDLQP